jgi:deazaflavin-dependent oxidoreductase (nitroreductase family)
MESGELPRLGSVMYDFHFRDEVTRKKKLRKWQKLNKYIMIPLYRSGILPLLGFGWIILILTTVGYKNGTKRLTPLEYRKIDGCITIFSAMGEKSAWVKNLLNNPEKVSVRHGFHHYKPFIEFIKEPEQKESIIRTYVVRFGKAARMLFGWDPKKDNPDSTDFTKLIDLISIIKLHKEKGHFS